MVVADGSGGTHAGLLAGLGDASPTRVLGVDVGTRPDLDDMVPALARDAADLAGSGPPNGTVLVDHDHVGAGYGELSDGCFEAIRLVARTEGLLLDPVYSGKAMAALFDAVRAGRIGEGDRVVFWATGGSPALFARRYEDRLTGP
jgi:1-aminocyclopropane-1-carboxylate deaminase/D-cysteine desulfhydrase-like pyridoxal-dependent ACC family enzyme